jgi:uncharacterized protein (TIGR00290 family)
MNSPQQTKEKVLFCWSGGKDSALALHKVLSSGQYEVVALLTTFNEHFQRVSMHGIRQELLEKQVEAIGLPLEKMFVSKQSSNEEYQEKMQNLLLKYKALGVEKVVFGDIFLEDLRTWRENNLAQVGMKAIFPIWKIDTRDLILEFVSLGFRSVICCVNDAYLNEDTLGKNIDLDFIQKLPAEVDPCGENGEYHSFACAGPIFKKSLPIKIGEKVYRPIEQTHPGSSVCPLPNTGATKRPQTKGFWFCDLTATDEASPV